MDDLERGLLAFVNERLLGGRAEVSPDTRLFEEGHLNSIRILELVAFLEHEIGRKVPDRMVRLANFRSVRAIARAFGPDEPAGPPERSYRYHTQPDRFASPVHELRRRGELTEDEDGSVCLGGRAAALFQYFDHTIAGWGLDLGADERLADARIPLRVLERAGFTDDFPQLLVRASDGEGYTPAACYHRYAELAGTTLSGATVLGVRAPCRRNEDEPRPLERLRGFTMREIVVLGTSHDVERVRRRLLRRVDRFVTALAFDGAIVPANDPFFTSAAAGRALAQRAGELKLELRLTLEKGRAAAVASFNRHHDHFGRRFGISLPDGSPAHSGCIAFGLERWVLAFLTQHGLNEPGWPDLVRNALALRRTHADPS